MVVEIPRLRQVLEVLGAMELDTPLVSLLQVSTVCLQTITNKKPKSEKEHVCR